jgi:peptidoglycan/LPS O-acetylase OafA/YrhL
VSTTEEKQATSAPVVAEEAKAAPTRFSYHASLDGLRALALLAIIAYHYDYGWARGAYLSVDLFFILSGFLITTLLLMEWRRSDGVALGTFWARRARRLLPALLVLLVFVTIFTILEIEPWRRADVRGDAIASLFYVANWRLIATEQGYFELFAAASPLRHMWTLAIEEQFYLVWPVIVLVAMTAARGSLRVLVAICSIGIVVSVIVMARVYTPGDPLRAYYGTDARLHTILMGALLAILLFVWQPSDIAKRRLAIVGALACVVMLYTWNVATGTSSRYYHGGSIAYAALACVVIAGAMHAGPLRAALGFGILVWIGRLSYGLYLFHWPIITWVVPSRVHLHGLPLNVLRFAITVALAALSFYLIELPVRERRKPTWPWKRAERVRTEPSRRRPRQVARWAALPAVALTFAIILASTTGAKPPPSYLVGERPKGNFIWGFGDPLFCGTPRPAETEEAQEQAAELGPPALERSAEGLRVLVLGDSVACSLYPGLAAVGDLVGASVEQASVFGCGIASGEVTTTRNEQITPHSERCPVMVQQAIDTAVNEFQPDVVLWISIWEKSDVLVNGTTLVSGTPEGDEEMLRRMDAALDRITAHDAKVVALTVPAPAPNDAQGTHNTSNAVDDASYARLDSILRRFVERHPDTVELVDFARALCPDGPPCPATVNGTRMRPDGRHLTPAAAATTAHWLMPQIVHAVRK